MNSVIIPFYLSFPFYSPPTLNRIPLTTHHDKSHSSRQIFYLVYGKVLEKYKVINRINKLNTFLSQAKLKGFRGVS